MPPKNRHIEVLRALWRELPDGMRSRAQPLVRRARRLAGTASTGGRGQGARTPPLLSVVVPIYNVEEYLDLCLGSLARQAVAKMEVIIVDDGSTDESLAIAQEYAAKDRRFSIIQQPNAGLGAARNSGIAHATGKYLGFADSDDVIPDGSYAAMLDALKTSGSDFAVGSFRRLAGEKKLHSGWAAELHSVRRMGTNINEFPAALQDVFAWNKIFSRTFWDAHIGWFPEGLLYEDQEMSSKAFLRAESFDMLPEVVYEWRIRSDRSSITQQKFNIRDLQDRLIVIGHMKSLMEAEATATVRDTWLAKVLGRDLGYYYRQIPRVDDEYWEVLQRSTAALTAQSGPAVWQRMKVQDRITVYLVAEGHRSDVETVLLHQYKYRSSSPLELRDGTLLAQPGFLPELEHEIPPELLGVDPSELRLETRLTAVRQNADGNVELEGTASLPGLDLAAVASNLAVRLRESNGRATVDLPTWPARDMDRPAAAPDAGASEFRTVVSGEVLERMLPESGYSGDDTPEWAIEISRSVAGKQYTGPFQSRDKSGTAAAMPLLPSGGDHRWDLRFDDERGVVCRLVAVPYTATDLDIQDRSLIVEVAASGAHAAPQSLVLEGPGACRVIGRPESSTPSGTVFRAELPPFQPPRSISPSKPLSWRIRAGTESGTQYPVSWPGTSGQLRRRWPKPRTLQPTANGSGHLEVQEFRLAIVAEAVAVDSGEIAVSGRAATNDGRLPSDVVDGFQLLAAGAGIDSSSVAFDDDGGFTARFPVQQEAWGRRVAAPSPGNYIFHYALRPEGASAEAPLSWTVPVSADLELTLPHVVQIPSATVRIARSAVAASLSLRFSAPSDPGERPWNTAVSTQPSLTDATFFESFSGRAAADSCLSIHRELMRRGDDRPKYWSVTDLSVAVPDGGIPVVRFSRQWYELLKSSAYLVNNGFFPSGFRKQPGQTYVQTWHGTPLKKIGHDGPTGHLNLSRLAALNQEPAEWDALLAQNDFAAQVLPAALRYRGEVMSLGCPRNDGLIAEGPDRRTEVRQMLGLSNDQTAVLYLPTWRDHITDFKKPHGHVDLLEPSILRTGLGDDWVVMRRSHPDMTGQRETLMAPDLDVSAYPDINDLYLAADIMVTDYSSVMFDFCTTAKPMYFLAPDLEAFRSGPRGFYLDLETLAPGPIVGNTRELAAVLRDDQTDSRDYRERLRAFASRFAGNDDGGAASRVVDAIW
ncbi:MAG TPA: CDP-glycerol glycerophosphotransferase family protein [Arthrobacter sp.]|nr:CDP-glycerol glycerophosphotransferase family protein [Arthrobacter sp.]